MSPRCSRKPYEVAPQMHAVRIYFAQAPDGLIKIGRSTNIGERLLALGALEQVPIKFLGRISGTQRAEHAWHDHFLALRDHGEWFHPTPRLFAGIADALVLGTTPDYIYIPEDGPYIPMRLGRRPAAPPAGERAR